MDFEKLIDELNTGKDSVLAIAAAEDDVVIKAAFMAQQRGIAKAILCGDKQKIEAIACEAGIDISVFEIISSDNAIEAAKTAVSLVRSGKADMLMKGHIQTADLLRAVLDRENGLRGESGAQSGMQKETLLSHVSIIYSPILERRLLITDGAMVPYPSLTDKVSLIENAVWAAKGLGIENPKVAPLAAVEVVNPKMQATLDAAALTEMNRKGKIRGCIVDGPLAMDLAISKDAARHKNIDSPVAGEADILLFHNIEAANAVAKTFTNAGNSLFGGVVMGASVPIVLTSRSDSDQSKLYSIACAACISSA